MLTIKAISEAYRSPYINKYIKYIDNVKYRQSELENDKLQQLHTYICRYIYIYTRFYRFESINNECFAMSTSVLTSVLLCAFGLCVYICMYINRYMLHNRYSCSFAIAEIIHDLVSNSFTFYISSVKFPS